MATKQFTRKGKSARSSSRPKQPRKRAPAKAGDQAGQPDWSTILGNFDDSRAVIETTCRSLENGDDYSEATSALRIGLRMFDSAYNDLDMAINRLARSR